MSKINYQESKSGKLSAKKVVAIWGSPNSGKTVVSVKLALALAKQKKSVILVLCDQLVPTIRTIAPKMDESQKSLGIILSSPEITQEVIIKNCVLLPREENLALIGYASGENMFSYPEYARERIVDLIILLRHLADYVIVDCSSRITEDLLTISSLELSDRTIRVMGADLKGVVYMQSVLPLLSDPKFRTANQLKVLNNTNDSPFKTEMIINYGGADFALPYDERVHLQALSGELLKRLDDNRESGFGEVIGKIVKGVFDE